MKINEILIKYVQFPVNKHIEDFIISTLGTNEKYTFSSIVSLNIFSEDQLKRILFFIYDISDGYKLEIQIDSLKNISTESKKEIGHFIRSNIIRNYELTIEMLISILNCELAYHYISMLSRDILYSYHSNNSNHYDQQFIKILDKSNLSYEYDLISIYSNKYIQLHLCNFKYQLSIYSEYILFHLKNDGSAISHYLSYEEIYKDRFFSPVQISDLIRKKFDLPSETKDSDISSITITYEESQLPVIEVTDIIDVSINSNESEESKTMDMENLSSDGLNAENQSNEIIVKVTELINPTLESNKPSLPKIESKITSKHASIFIDKIFMKDEIAFVKFMTLINHSDSWESVSREIDNLFKENKINLYSTEAIMFTDLIQTHFE